MALPTDPTKFEDWLERLLLPYFLPSPTAYRRPLARALPWLSLILLFLLILMAAPPIRDSSLNYWISATTRHSWKINKTEIVSWIECMRIAVEVTIGIAIGGQIFSTALKSRLQSLLQQYEEDRQKILQGNYQVLREEIRELAKYFWVELNKQITIFQVPSHIWRLICITQKFYIFSFKEISRFHRQLLIISMFTSFPGGLFGVIAYSSFILLVAVKIAKLYMESPALP